MQLTAWEITVAVAAPRTFISGKPRLPNISSQLSTMFVITPTMEPHRGILTRPVQRRSAAIAMESTNSGYPKPAMRRYSTPIRCICSLSVYRRMTVSGKQVAITPNSMPTDIMQVSVTP